MGDQLFGFVRVLTEKLKWLVYNKLLNSVMYSLAVKKGEKWKFYVINI